MDEDDEEPVLFESEEIWFSKNPDGHYVIASLDGSIALRFARLWSRKTVLMWVDL